MLSNEEAKAVRDIAPEERKNTDGITLAICLDYLKQNGWNVDGHTVSNCTAEWLIYCDGYYPYCSHCKTEPRSGIMTDFCPTCGYKMRKRC